MQIESSKHVLRLKRNAQGVLIASWLLSGLAWVRISGEFLVSPTGAAAAALLAAAGSLVISRRMLNFERHPLVLELLIFVTVGFFSFCLVECALYQYTVCFGKPIAFATTVERKGAARRLYVVIKESLPVYITHPRVDRATWNAISPGMSLTIRGRQSIFGRSIYSIEATELDRRNKIYILE